MRLLTAAFLLTACRGVEPIIEDEVVEGCRAGPGPSERVVLVSHPYAADDTSWSVLSLDADGEIAAGEQTVQLGRATGGVVAFTPDGSVGLVALEDGGLGHFTVDAGVVTVVSTGPFGDRYIDAVAMHPSGERALLLDPNWRDNGGAVVEVGIDCATGDLTELRSWPSKLAYAALAWGDEWVVAAEDVGGSASADVHRLRDDAEASGALFPDEDAIISSMAVAEDIVILADFSAFGGGNRLGVGRLEGSGIDALSVIPNVEDPVSIAVSPSADAALVSSGFGDALIALAIDPLLSSPVMRLGEIAYEGDRPALPAGIATVDSLGLAFVAENLGVRRVRFRPGGEIVDLGAFAVGTDTDSVVGAIGVQP